MSSKRKFNWGIIGTSRIASDFCTSLQFINIAELHSVLGSSAKKAKEFSDRYPFSKHTDTLEDFLKDDQLDVVYIASPTRLHFDHVSACLNAGKAVLCEKPIVTSVDSLNKLIAVSSEKSIFCMEAMWMRFNPLIQQARELISNNHLGTVLQAELQIGYNNRGDRLMDPQRGAIWDFSVYAFSLLEYLFGLPISGSFAPSRVKDGPAAGFSAILQWEERSASIHASIDTTLSNEANFYGSEGTLKIGPPFFNPSWLHSSSPLKDGFKGADRINKFIESLKGSKSTFGPHYLSCEYNAGLRNEALHVMELLKIGKTQSPVMPLKANLRILKFMENLFSHPPESSTT